MKTIDFKNLSESSGQIVRKLILIKNHKIPNFCPIFKKFESYSPKHLTQQYRYSEYILGGAEKYKNGSKLKKKEKFLIFRGLNNFYPILPPL